MTNFFRGIPSREILQAVADEFRRIKQMAEEGLAQLSDGDLFRQLDPWQPSIGAMLKHLIGNITCRWTDFLVSDNEKPEPGETDEAMVPRQEMMESWEQAWNIVQGTLLNLSDEDLLRTVKVRGEAMTAFAAINRQTAHYAYHLGQILLLGKHIKGEAWKDVVWRPAERMETKKAG